MLVGIDLELPPRELVIMSGPSGSGTTTLLSLIGALRRVQTGRLSVLGQDLAALSEAALLRQRLQLGFIFQHHNLFPALTAMQSVCMALELLALGDAERRARAKAMLEGLGLGHRLDYKPEKLSGGQRQRVAIARALVIQPRLVLADEPTAALDKDSGQVVLELFARLVEDTGATVLMVTHDTRLLQRADRIVNLVDGRVASNVQVREMVELCRVLHKSGLFSGDTPGELMEVAQKMRLERFETGQPVVRQGDTADRFYLIRSGAANVQAERDGATREVTTLRSGAYFGERALLVQEPRNATVVASGPLEVYSLGKHDFESAVARKASFKDQLLKMLLHRS